MYIDDGNLGSWLSKARKKLRKLSPSHMILKKLTGKETLVDVFVPKATATPVSATPVASIVEPSTTDTGLVAQSSIVQTQTPALPTQGYVVSPYATSADNAPNYGNLTPAPASSQTLPTWALPVAAAALVFAVLQRRR